MTEFKHVRLDGKVYDKAEIKKIIKEQNVKFIKLQFVDINGQVKNMSVPSEQIDKVLNNLNYIQNFLFLYLFLSPNSPKKCKLIYV